MRSDQRVSVSAENRKASKDAAARELCGTAAPGGVSVVKWSATLFQTVRATLREIFDESAYDRFLRQKNGAASVASYREFMREREAALATKPRCC